MASDTPGATTRSAVPSAGALLRGAGAGLLLATGGIHLDLYLTGYRHIPTIGPLFLLQVVSAFVLAGAVLVIPRRLVALGGAGFAVTTLGGYILSLWIGLFGFDEVRTTAGVVAGALEVATFVVLGAYAAWYAPEPTRSTAPPVMIDAGRRSLAPLGALALLAFVLAVANSPGAPAGSGRSKVATSAQAIHVTIKNFTFAPARFTVAPGERIVVTNDDSVTHTFTATPGATPVAHFTTGNIAPGSSASLTAPTAKGAYAFHCAIHPFMTGTLTVE
ncbi:MAG: hypothetical protein JWO62_351 [Acidimicrobiaceae bacterium]|jgi:plastocyanin|nr:hypothetical protein [Acidimicrobiaceae bacterium]